MRIQLLGAAVATIAAVALAVGTAGTSSEPDNARSATPRTSALAAASDGTILAYDAARLAKQASFGPTPELIASIVAKKSVSAWLDEQFALSSSTYADLAAKAVPVNYCAALADTAQTACKSEHFWGIPVQMRFYANAVGGDDQLRQRVAFALSQIIVTSAADIGSTAGLASFDQILLSNAFGNYRDILKAVTLNAFMGEYLDVGNSSKLAPSENYARELMQLFSIGTVLLNPDGTPQTDNAGTTVATYSNTDVKEIARALTGWTFPTIGGVKYDGTNRSYSSPMLATAATFDSGSKTFLGKTIPANADQLTNVDAVVDAVFNHPNTAPFISKRLIQQLTLANPTPAYVERVATVFADNGAGVRGDLKAVVRAIYLDPEARNVSQLPGKVKEPVLLATSLARAIDFKSDGYAFTARDVSMGQSPFRAPSVFNFYPYDFPLPQGAGLISPVGKLMTTSTTMARHNFVYDWTVGGDPTRGEFKPTLGATGTVPDWASWEAYGTDDGKILDRINLVLLNGTMTKAQRQSLLTAMAQIKNSDPKAQTRKRAQMALYVVASSPLFQVDR